MSSSVFVATSGLLCIHDRSDLRNASAIQLFKNAARLFTTNYVLAEFIPLTEARKLDRERSIAFLEDFLNVPRLELIWIDRARHAQAMELLRQRLDKTYSLCDATSFVVMREYGLTEALTTDKHFKQEGFVRLLES